jgi:hypothetical protein
MPKSRQPSRVRSASPKRRAASWVFKSASAIVPVFWSSLAGAAIAFWRGSLNQYQQVSVAALHKFFRLSPLLFDLL